MQISERTQVWTETQNHLSVRPAASILLSSHFGILSNHFIDMGQTKLSGLLARFLHQLSVLPQTLILMTSVGSYSAQQPPPTRKSVIGRDIISQKV